MRFGLFQKFPDAQRVARPPRGLSSITIVYRYHEIDYHIDTRTFKSINLQSIFLHTNSDIMFYVKIK